jgi:hypothetical protein
LQQPCAATTAAGRPCRGWAVGGSDPPRCGAHGGGQRPNGAPAGNSNALKLSPYASQPYECDAQRKAASNRIPVGYYIAIRARDGLRRLAELDNRYPSRQLEVLIDRAIARLENP